MVYQTDKHVLFCLEDYTLFDNYTISRYGVSTFLEDKKVNKELEKEIMTYCNSFDLKGEETTLSNVVDRIKTGSKGLDALTDRCRNLVNSNIKQYKKFKESRLPAVTFSGVLKTRDGNMTLKQKGVSHSGLVTLDFDDIDVAGVMSEVTQMPSTVLAFVSPSGTGVKAVVSVSPVPAVGDAREHRAAWNAADEVYSHIAVVDPSGTDATRLCYLSHYPNVFFETENRESVQWDLESDDLFTSQKENRLPRHKTKIDVSILDYILADEYKIWLDVGMACHKEGLDLSVWDRWSQRSDKYQTGACDAKWKTFNANHQNAIGWGSIVELARQHGYVGKPTQNKKQDTNKKVTIADVKTKIKTYVIDQSNITDNERSDTRRDIFDMLALLSPSDIESLILEVSRCLELKERTVKSEVAARQKENTDIDYPNCPQYTSDGKRVIWVTQQDALLKQQGTLTDEVFDALRVENENEPFIFNNDGWVSVRNGTERISMITCDELKTILADRFHWMRVVKTKKEGVSHIPVGDVPIGIVKGVEHHKDRHVKIPKLERVVNRPVLRSEGSFFVKRGYVPNINAFLLSDFDVNLMSSVKNACTALLEPFMHFPFTSKKDRACAFAYLFTLLLRERLGDHVPFFYFGAARQGTGKGLLCNSLYHIAEGCDIPHSVFHRDEESLKRSVASNLLGGDPGILFDNLSDGYVVKSPFLELLATAPVVPVRILYRTQESYVRVNSVVSFTGNNLSFDSGLRRRVQECRLESNLEFPERREGLPNLRALVRNNRGSLLSAALTIIKEWHSSGCPENSINLGSFETWGNVISAVLEVAGIKGFNPVKSITMSDRDVARRLFIQSVWSEIGDTEWGVKDVFNIATTSEDGEGQNILHQFLVGDPKKSLGHLLRAFDGQVFNFDDISLRVRRVENTSPVMYKIERLVF